MKRHLLAIALLGACTDSALDNGSSGGGGKSDNPNAAFTDVATKWEATVGYAGDAVVNQVTEGPAGSLLVTSMYPRWLRQITADGKPDTTWGSKYAESSQRSGYLDLTAHDIWRVGSNHLVASVGDGLLYQLNGFLGDGTPDTAFGNAGTALLPYSDGTPLRIAYDEEVDASSSSSPAHGRRRARSPRDHRRSSCSHTMITPAR